jgi:hypothetical protein
VSISLTHFSNWVIFLDYKYARKLPNYDNVNTTCMGMEVCAIRKAVQRYYLRKTPVTTARGLHLTKADSG